MGQSSANAAVSKTGGKSARDRVFAVASDLFYRKGIHAVGVEQIVKDAGVAKISLYRNFASKDELVVAYLEERNRTFLRQWDETFEAYRDDPPAQLRAIMTYVIDRTTQDGYRGCPFINFSAEFPDPDHPGRRVARATKQALRERFERIARALCVPKPQQLADGLLLLVEGAYAISQTFGGGANSPGHALIWAAEGLVAAQRASSGKRSSRSG
jgi:AcrR family transcriptional regulator